MFNGKERKESKSPQRTHVNSNGYAPRPQANSSNYTGTLVILVILTIGLGFLNYLEIRNIRVSQEQVFSELSEVETEAESGHEKPKVWIQGKRLESGYLIHVIEMFERLGYQRVNGSNGEAWDVLWAHEYPFTQSILDRYLEPHQRVNHFPGSGYITNKVSLATSKLDHIPRAFNLPKDKDEFIEYASEHRDKLWVKKSNDHRGIRVEDIASMNLTTAGTFVQEFIQNPLLIDGKKFDIGIYVIMTSVNPLRVYALESDALLRFCAKDYLPFNSSDLNSYVVGDDYTPIWEVPSMKKYFTDSGLNMKDALSSYLRSIGKDPEALWGKIEESIAQVYTAKEHLIGKLSQAFETSRHFFEMVRFDYVVDDNLNIYLMEANMSPNLSSQHFGPNKLLYEQVIFNVLSLAGVAQTVHVHNWRERNGPFWNFMVGEKDLSVFPDLCSSQDCHLSCRQEKCKVCLYCLDDDMKTSLKDATIEELSRWNTKRLVPSINRVAPSSPRDVLQAEWFKGKCQQNSKWCA